MPDQNSSTHARLSMSRLPRIVTCPGSIPLYEDYLAAEGIEHVDKPSAAANEGTYLHEVTERYLRSGKYEIDEVLHEDRGKHLDFKSWVEENLEWVKGMREASPSMVEHIETHVSMSGYVEALDNPLLTEVAGTCDYACVIDRTLHICDWKYGHGIVYPDSEQLMGYAAAFLKNFDAATHFDHIVLHIGQPRAEDSTHKIYELGIQELFRWVKHELSPAIKQTEERPYVLKSSDKACMFCPMKARCSARRDANMADAAKAFAQLATPPGTLSNEEIAETLLTIERVSKYKNDLLKFAFTEISAGRTFPGRKIVAKSGRRAWKDEHLAIKVLEEHDFDLEDLSEVKIFSPAKVEKAIGKKMAKEEWFTDLCPKGEGSHTLVKESDPRPAIEFQTVTERFAEYINDDESED